MSCEYTSSCLNSNKCYRCFSQELLKLPFEKKLKSMRKKSISSFKEANKKDSWKRLEQDVSDKLNYIPKIQEARRTRRSGGLWFEQGDIKDTILHPECKEREGKILKSGDKSITLQREWLIKAKSECEGTSKFMCLPFRFKGDDDVYVLMDFDDIAELVTLMKSYIIDNDLKTKEIIELLKLMTEK